MVYISEGNTLKVIGFVGPSGTGKSYRSTWVAGERGIEFIIDDGLLISGNSIVAGESAKKEKTKIASIKRALFTVEAHARVVRDAIDFYKPHSILILGTSNGMIESITKRLHLPDVSEIINITEVADEYEISQAISTRKEQGKHVIPVPTFEIKRDFSGYFLDPLRIFKKKSKMPLDYFDEKSVVRPTFSYLGNYTISDYTIYQIVEHIAHKIEGIGKVARFNVRNNEKGILIDMDIILFYGYPIKPLVMTFKNEVSIELEKLTALNIIQFDVYVKTLIVKKQNESRDGSLTHN